MRPLTQPSRPVVASRGVVLACAVLALLAVPARRAPAQGFLLPPHFEAVPLPGGFNLPVGLAFAPDGHLFVIEKPGTVRVLDASGNEQSALFLDLTAEVNNDHDRGLLGIALHPGFVADGGARSWVYLLYTVSPIPPNDNSYNGGNKFSFSRLVRYRAVTAAGVISATAGSRQVLLGNQLADGSVPDGIASLHEGHSNGSLHFADDGTLMVSVGDGAHYDFADFGGNDNAGFDDVVTAGKKGPTPKLQDEGAFRSQDPRSLAGKLLRINPANGQGYASNPFFDGDLASNRSKVWALGLRNPYRMDLVPGTGATDPAAGQPNVVILGDVGWNTWEELDACRFGGENFGWPCYEGFLQQSGYQAFTSGNPDKVTCHTAPTGALTLPLLAWSHSNPNAMTPAGVHEDASGNPLPGFGGNCSIGGTVYTGGSYPAEYVGREFFADYTQGAIKTLELDGSFGIVAVRDFAAAAGNVVDIERHPSTGDLYLCELITNRIYHLRYDANLTPIAVASATPTLGPAPLSVQFSSAGSLDPEGSTLSYDWDFGDGSAHAGAANPQHTYAQDGLHHARLVVQDPQGLSSQDDVPITVGIVPPTAVIVQPAMGSTYDPPATIAVQALPADPGRGPLTYGWKVDLYHADHVHFGTFQLSGRQGSFDITGSPEQDELMYYRVELTVTDTHGVSAQAHVFIYPNGSVVDPTGTARPIARIQSLVPPTPIGGGNGDIEVIRDKVTPVVGSTDGGLQFDTYHAGEQGNDDWIGYELVAPADAAFRFTGLQFQEGIHFWDGGWFKDLHAEVRQNGTWAPVSNASLTPDYPFELAEQGFFDLVPYQTYELRFDPAVGDAVRLRGTPGGVSQFISCGELVARAIDATPEPTAMDITAQGTIVAAIFALTPPESLGPGNHDPELIRNGTFPEQGSASSFAQFDTFHNGEQGDLDWIGYDFGQARTFTRVVFQEGLDLGFGGAFETLALQVQHLAHGPWMDVGGVAVSPPYGALDGVNYETHVLEFPPVTGRALRIAGPPAGGAHFISVGELRVFGPALPDGCGFFPYGQNLGGANTLTLDSGTPPLLGLPIEIRAAGALRSSLGLLTLAGASASVPLKGGTLLVKPAGLLTYPIAFDAAGAFKLATTLPVNPALNGLSAYMQVVAVGQPVPDKIRFSNGLRMAMCLP